MVLAVVSPQADAQKPLPFAYVGKVVRDGERYAVIVRDGTVDFVRAGDTIGGEYRVQSVADDRLLVMDLERGVVQMLALGAPPRLNARPKARARACGSPGRARRRSASRSPSR